MAVLFDYQGTTAATWSGCQTAGTTSAPTAPAGGDWPVAWCDSCPPEPEDSDEAETEEPPEPVGPDRPQLPPATAAEPRPALPVEIPVYRLARPPPCSCC